MNFISIEFIIFLGIVFLLYIILTHRLQNRMLLVASYVFYGWWDWRFLSLLIISSVVDYYCGLIVDRSRNPHVREKTRKAAISASVTVNLGILGIFKYYDFFIDPLISLVYTYAPSLFLGYGYTSLNIILPVGISFYTFQSMSYSIDVYRGKLRSTKTFLDFMLYVSFFPQLVAGPIERGRHLLPQIINPRTIRLDRFYSGAQLAFWGFFKKMVIADNMAFIVNKVFSTASPSGVEVVLAVYAFSIQIYCDFSGYTVV